MDYHKDQLEALSDRARLLEDRSHQVRRELSEIRVDSTSRDQSVMVSVNSTGMMLAVRFSPRARELTGQQLSNSIMQAYRHACSEAAQRTVEIMSEFAGDESSVVDFLRSAIPSLDGEGEY